MTITPTPTPAARVSGTIKALEWDHHPDAGHDPRCDEHYGGKQSDLTGKNEYDIYPHPCADGLYVLDVMGSRTGEDFPSVEAAKAAAQADYGARILAAIQPDPEPVSTTKQNYGDCLSSDPETQPVAWRPIETAPYQTPVIVRVGSEMSFRAVLCKDASLDEGGNDCDQWQADIEGECPECWTDGACWSENSNGYTSLQPSGWHPATPSSAGMVSVEAAAKVLLDSSEFQHLLCEHEAGLDETVAALRALAGDKP